MSRLIDIDELKGCAIIRPTTHEEIEHIRACKNLISHDDIPTAMERSTAYYNDDWIPASERMPEERDWYLAVFQEPDTGFIGLPYIADYLLGAHTNYTTNEGWIIKDCTDHDGACEYYKDLLCVAWQPLPAPYQPKGEK